MQLSKTAIAQNSEQLRQTTYQWLLGACSGNELSGLIARMLASQVTGFGAMPRWLGLSRAEFDSLMQHHLPGINSAKFGHYGKELDPERSGEHKELRELFLYHGVADSRLNGWVADILIAGCMGGDHLWQDLGLWSRDDLTTLIRAAFTPLADKNVNDMKWKKFFYKQLCIQEGVYTCRAPSCQVCVDYQRCFGPE